jgi:ankyrin repeat protein
LPPDINALYRRVIELGDEETNSTVIHDSLIARTSLTVEEAINLKPECIDTMDNLGLSPLQWAVLRNNVQGIEVLLSWNPNLELCDYDKRVALHRAAEFGLIECAQMLISKGAYVDASDAWGDTPLHLAISLPSTQMLNLLLSNGAKILRNKYGRSPIHGSVFGSFPHDEAVIEQYMKALQIAGADINALDYSGMTPLLVAVQQSHIPMLNTLQRLGADIEEKSTNTNGRTLFHIAAMFSDSDMVRRLREARLSLIDPDETDEDGLTAMEMLSRRLTLSATELTEGQQPATINEISLFQSFIDEARERYLMKNTSRSWGVSTKDAELVSHLVHDDPLHSTCDSNEDNSESNSDTDGFSEAVEYQ